MPLSAGAAKASVATGVTVTAVGRYRWTICTLLFFITTINYMDRQVIGVLKPVLQNELGWTEIDYGNIIFFFSISYPTSAIRRVVVSSVDILHLAIVSPTHTIA